MRRSRQAEIALEFGKPDSFKLKAAWKPIFDARNIDLVLQALLAIVIGRAVSSPYSLLWRSLPAQITGNSCCSSGSKTVS